MSVLRTMLQSAIYWLAKQGSPETLAKNYDPMFEVTLIRLVTAIKVLYGYQAIVEEDLVHLQREDKEERVSEVLRKTIMVQTTRVYNRLEPLMKTYAARMLKGNRHVRTFVTRWRAARKKA